jgi:hypothetical protein
LAVQIAYPPRNERDILDGTPHRGDDHMDDIVPLLEENEWLGADKSGAENTNDISSLLEENAQLRGLVVTLSNIMRKSVADQSSTTSLSAPVRSASEIGLRAAYHAHSEKPSPIFSTPAAAFCCSLLRESASKRTWPDGAHTFPLKDQEMKPG